MAIGLTRAKNLSERNLNLKTALQKLYAPGIEDDITLFSLSSSVESAVVSGLLDGADGQIVGIRNESISSITGTVQLRTKFLTKFFTFTDLNEVNFEKFTLVTPGGAGSVLPKTSQDGELYSLDIISAGQGFYFQLPNGTVLNNSASTLNVENVSIRGLISGKETAKAKVTFIKSATESITSEILPVVTSYDSLTVRGSLYYPTSGNIGSSVDVIILYHGTIGANGENPILSAEYFLDLVTNSSNLNIKDKIIFSVACPQDAIPEWVANNSLISEQFPELLGNYGGNYNNFLFGDNIEYAEAALLWVKNNLNAYMSSNGIPKTINKIFTFGHSQGAYLVHRLNTMHSVNGVISNAPGPIDLLDRCSIPGEQTANYTCNKIGVKLGTISANPGAYNSRSLKSYLSGTLSPTLFTQALDDTPYQVNLMQTIVQPGLESCVNCASAEFKYYATGGHAAFVANPQLQADIRQFFKSGTGNADLDAELTRFTPGSTDRYSVASIEITDSGSGYIFPERLELVEGNITRSSDSSPIVLKKQRGRYFSGQPELLRSRVYAYQVRGASGSGFFLYDTQENKYVYLGRNTSETGFLEEEQDSIELRRFDGININNFFQFKFAQSSIWLNDNGDEGSGFRIENGSISGEISRVASVTNSLQLRTQAAVQNTRRPTPSTSSENILGYVYNSFDGEDVVIWQRLVLRDPDFILDPSNPDFTANSITGTRLRESVQNFELSALNSTEKIRIPGLFIKVGTQYFRAFSTTDKPFFAESLNPKMSSGSNQYALSAETLVGGSTTTLYSYDTIIAQLAQRISSNGINGALYYHRSTAPTRRTVQAKDGNNTSVNIYAIPLFSLR